jgi:hypothetical protein
MTKNAPLRLDAKVYDRSGNCILITKGYTTRMIVQLVHPLYPSRYTVIVKCPVEGLKGDMPIVAEQLVKIIRRS